MTGDELEGSRPATRARHRDHAHLLALLALYLPAVLSPTDPPQRPMLCLATDLGPLSFPIDPLDLDLFEHVERATGGDSRTAGGDSSATTVQQRIRRLVATAHADDIAIARLIDLAESLDLDPEILDEDVIDIHCNDASEMNNSGFSESIPYLYRALGETELEQRLLSQTDPKEAA
ncbi:hypothetical protein [Nocardia altamirensis]|uniref:hypothetical protein n=1 Tax=Nocardia altamirensis TaxID=472158 RepID=UPI0008400C55|nr:hypothetical protein [Nocardia altamirensis]